MNTAPDTTPSLLQFWQPRYWPLWLGVGLLRLLVLLPFRVQLLLGTAAGRLLYLLLPKRRAVAAVNLRICFPELGEAGRQRLLRRHFAALGMAIFELAMAWWASDRRILGLVHFDGIEHLLDTLKQGHGAVILSAHFSGTELTGRALRIQAPEIAGMYRPFRNPFVDALMMRPRLRALALLIPKNNMRQLIRTLRNGFAVWYAPDQAYRRQYSVLVPFFGEPAMTNAALTHIARLSGSPVVPYLPQRLPGSQGYAVKILPALQDFPSGDLATDARRVMALFEEHIRLAPEQYYWVHRRFKDRPEGYPDPYRRTAGSPDMPSR